MSTSDSAAFASKPFTFIVQGTSLYVHSALVSECSKPLDRMINGDLSEAKQGFAVLEDVDRATFVRFIRWIYTRDYPAPEHIYFDTGDEEEVGSKKAKKMIKEEKIEAPKNTLRESFITRDNPLSSTWKSGLGNSTPSARGNKGPQEDYTEVFLGHARMYVFAEKYDIEQLQSSALQKLHHTLAIHTLYPEGVGDITSLLKYVYANTAETKEGSEDIRTMLAHYIGTEMPTLIKDGEIKDLMLDNGEILGDFLKMFASRVS